MEQEKLVEIFEHLERRGFVKARNLLEDNDIYFAIIPNFERILSNDRIFVYPKDKDRAIEVLKANGFYTVKEKPKKGHFFTYLYIGLLLFFLIFLFVCWIWITSL